LSARALVAKKNVVIMRQKTCMYFIIPPGGRDRLMDFQFFICIIAGMAAW
jgi:hypothetical protein